MDRTTFNNKRIANFSGEVTNTTARGSSFTGYANNKVIWQGQLSDAARMNMYFLDSVDVRQLPEKSKQYVVPFRSLYPLSATVSFETSEYAGAGDIANFGTNYIDGKVIEPVPYSKAATIGNYANWHNIQDLIRDKMDELSYALTDKVDNYISAALSGATLTTSTTAGAMILYGSTAYSDATLTAGMVLTPEKINEAEVLLSGKYAYYWNGSTFTKSSATKNPWKNEPTDPYVLIIGPRQKQALRNSGQFISANLYGDRTVISAGEIGEFVGVGRIICSNNIQQVAAGGTALDGGSAPSVDISECILMKGRAAYTFVWGRTPTFMPWERQWQDARGITLVCDFAGAVVHADAIVKIHVADQ